MRSAIPMGLVITGGTIGPLEKDGLLVIDLTDKSTDNGRQVFVKAWPGPERLDLHTRTPVQKLSESITPGDWVNIAAAVRGLVEINGCESVVVLHGTDTAHFTSAALALLLTDVSATVVVTGSNMALSEVNTDARTNVKDAIAVSRALPHGVYFSFAGVAGERSDVYRGMTFRKFRADEQGYRSLNHSPVATAFEGNVSMSADLIETEPQSFAQAMSNDVAYIELHPGIDLAMFADALIASGKRGVVVKLFSSGTGSENTGADSLAAFARRCETAGIVMVMTVEHFNPNDAAFPSRMAATRAGAIYAADMLPETSYVKLCWALAQETSTKSVKMLFLTPIAGESKLLVSNLVV